MYWAIKRFFVKKALKTEKHLDFTVVLFYFVRTIEENRRGCPDTSGRIREDGEIPSRPRHCNRFEGAQLLRFSVGPLS